jgi:hypothetical protein
MKFYPADYMRDGELWADADNFERALAKLNRIALAVAGNRDDPLGDDFPDEIGLPTAVQGLTGALERVAHDAGGLGIEGGILEEGHHNGHETLPGQAAAQLSQSFTFGQNPCGCRDNSIELATLDRSGAYDPRRAK